jgi:mannose-6-phosphate isomerase
MGLDGKPREMHIDKGVQVSNVESLPEITHPTDELLVSGTYFQTVRHVLDDASMVLNTDGHFHALTCIAGTIWVRGGGEVFNLSAGQTALVPAALGEYTVSGTGILLRSLMV